jgi:hypothetical protein
MSQFWSTYDNTKQENPLEKRLKQSDVSLEAVFEDENFTDNLSMQNETLID